MRLKDKTALITGASRGLGKAMAEQFAAEGASVVVNFCLNEESANNVCRAIADSGGKALPIQADVADASSVARMVEESLRTFGKIDILINNAGRFITSSWADASLNDFDTLLATNVKGIIHCTQSIIPGMIGQNYGRIVNISSVASLGTAFPGTSIYGATKAAVNSITKRLAYELGPHQITVNGICPGYIKTDMALQDLSGKDKDEQLRTVANKAMLRRVGEPIDIANVALFLASDEASFITGQILTVDGGRMDYLSYSS